MKTYLVLPLLIGGLAAATPSIAKQCDWRISGRLNVEHELPEMQAKFGNKQPLHNIQVKLSAKTGSALPWGEWDTVRTNSDGEFSIHKEKSCADRYFKIEVKFDDATLELRHETSTSSLTKVKWYEAWNSANLGNKKPPSTVDLGTLTFGPGAGIAGNHERADFQVYRHAQLWTVMKLLMNTVADFGEEYAVEGKVEVKYPHESAVAGDGQASYTNPLGFSKVIYIHKGVNGDHFNMFTIAHEFGHRLFYDKFDGEGCLTWDLILTHDTHDMASNSCPAHHEGLAAAFQERFEFEQFGEPMGRPMNRAKMKARGLRRPDQLERLDDGWHSIFRAMMDENLGRLNFGTADDPSGDASYGFIGECTVPKVNLKRLIKIYLADGDKGFFRDMTKDETRMEPFLSRAAAILANFDEDHRDAIAAAHDSRLDSEPADFMCEKRVITKEPGDLSGGLQTARPIGQLAVRP